MFTRLTCLMGSAIGLTVAAASASGQSPFAVPGSGTAPVPVMPSPSSDKHAEKHSSIRLVSELNAIAPGQTVMLGLHMTITPGWHTYWHGRSDSGSPLMVEFDVPPGVTLGPWQWPTPQRHISAGDILDHIYENHVTILVPLTLEAVPASSAQGEASAAAPKTITIKGKAEWLVCQEACVFEDGQVELTLPVIPSAEAAKPTAEAGLIRAARERVPAQTAPAGFTASWTTDRVTLTVPGSEQVEFFPAADCVGLIDPIRTCSAKGQTLQLQTETAEGTEGNDRLLRGVIRYQPAQPAQPATTSPSGKAEPGQPAAAIKPLPPRAFSVEIAPRSTEGGENVQSPANPTMPPKQDAPPR